LTLSACHVILNRMEQVTLKDIRQAARIIGDRVRRTPLVHSPMLSRLCGGEIWLKLENLQKTGSFKIRGATFKILANQGAIGPEGVIAASAGNHAQGVALAARNAGIAATVVMPEWASIGKQEATANYGGKVIIAGASIADSLARAEGMAGQGYTLVHPFDDAQIIAGQGTIGLEIMVDLPQTGLIVAPIGGGGLISGIGVAAKQINPAVRIVGVQAAACPAARDSLAAGRITNVEGVSSIADGISVKQPGQLTFSLMSCLLESVAVVEEEQIASALLFLLERKKILVEGAGAVPVAALLNHKIALPADAPTVLVISGGNVDSPLLGRIINRGLIENGRVMRVWVQLNDVPGALAKLLTLVAGLGANVLTITHERHLRHTPLFYTRVMLEMETRGQDHVERIAAALCAGGYAIEGCEPGTAGSKL